MNRQQYIDILELYLSGSMPAAMLSEKVLRMHRDQVSAEKAIRASWDEPHDQRLVDMRHRGEINKEEFDVRWRMLFPLSDAESATVEIAGSIMETIDYWFDNEDGSSPGSEESRIAVENELRTLLLRLKQLKDS